MLTAQDKEILRSLARTYAEYAALPAQAETRRLWEALNACRMERPMALFDQLPWNELDIDGSLVCRVSDPWWRLVECALRREIYKWEHMRADMVLTPYIRLPSPAWHTGYGLEPAVRTISIDKTSDVRAQSFECQFNTMDDVEKIKAPHLVFDREGAARHAVEADDLFGDIVGWRFEGMVLHLGVWDWISQHMGVTNVYMALYDSPDMLHAMMERFTEGLVGLIGEMNEARVFDLYSGYCHCSHTFQPSDASGTDVFKEKGDIGGTGGQSWAFGLAQLFTSVSPDVTEEFEVAYMKRVFPYIGNIYYGCCDKLSDRLDRILQLPNVRKISCSPWSDADEFAANLPSDKVMSVKPNPAFFAASTFRLDDIRADLSAKLAAAMRHGCAVEFLFKDISTVKYAPQNLWDTAKMAVELFSE